MHTVLVATALLRADYVQCNQLSVSQLLQARKGAACIRACKLAR